MPCSNYERSLPVTSEHMWVQMTYTPIEVTPKPDGTLDVHESEAAAEVAKDEALYGCWFCFTPLGTDTFGTPCSGQLIIQT